MDMQASLKTERGSSYLQTLCKHFGRKTTVRFDTKHGVIELPFGKCDLHADAAQLDLSVSADTQEDLERTAHVITSHLERYAFRENPDLVWRPAGDMPAKQHA